MSVLMLSIDHMDGADAVCEDDQGDLCRIARSRLPEDAREGCIIAVADDGRIALCPEETDAARKKALELQHKLFPRND